MKILELGCSFFAQNLEQMLERRYISCRVLNLVFFECVKNIARQIIRVFTISLVTIGAMFEQGQK
jgi:hypothetical protein